MNKKLLRKKLALMLATLKKKRPYYCEVEYLQATGTQYINTGYTLDNNSETEIICNSGNIHETNLFGCREASANSRNISITTPVGVAYTSDFNNSDYATYRVSMDGSGDKIVKIILSKNERGFYNLDGSLINRSTTVCPDVFTCGSSAYLMNVAGSPYFTTSFKGKLYRCTIKESGVLVRDFIPVLDWDYVPCMYDNVTGQLFYNAGTGNFTAGREIHSVDYLENSGTQYIDTGFKPTSKTRWEYDYQFNNTSSSYIGNGMFITAPSTQRFSIGLIGASFNMSYGADKVVSVPSDTDRHMFIIDANNMYWKIDNSTGTYSTAVTDSLNRNIYFFARNGGSPYNAHSGKLYGSKIYNDGILVRDYKPAIDENGVGFMFDRVSHTIFDNAGTDAFKYPARELECIQSTGTQYLDTGWNPGANAGKFTFDIEVQCTANTSGHGAIGSRSVDNGRNWVITNVTQTPTNQTVSQYGYGNTYQNVTSDTSNKWARMRTYIDGSNYVFETTVDGVTSIETMPVQTFTNTASVYLLGINNKGSLFSAFPFVGKMRRARLYDNGTLVKDYKPAFKNGYFGFWDSVNDYMPAITGTVTHGKIVEPEYE